MKVCIGGTFSPLHHGHKVLLRTACDVAGKKGLVYIGLTSDTMAKKKGAVASYEQRKQAVERFFADEKVTQDIQIEPLSDRYGPTLHGDYDAIIVSEETKPVAEEINNKRRERQKKPLQIVAIPLLLSDDKKPLSSTRIRRKEIDENGRVLHQK